MQISKAISLKPYHTCGVNVYAREFTRIKTIEQLVSSIKNGIFKNQEFLILGEGSDVLFVNDFNGIIIKNELKGIEVVNEPGNKVRIKAASGENWHTFVEYCVNNNWGGLENLALIPGTVGASPIQNIGAYGTEVKNTLKSIEAINLKNGSKRVFSNEELKLSYRWSIFKEKEIKNSYYIISCNFELDKNPVVTINYKDLQEELAGKEKTVQNVFNAIVTIRKRKLPDVNEYGNAGSFFKNPCVSEQEFSRLKEQNPDIIGFHTGRGLVKLAAAQLIDMCGWKGVTLNGAGVYQNHALVIVNYGNASGKDIYELSVEIRKSVYEKFGIRLIPEVNIIK